MSCSYNYVIAEGFRVNCIFEIHYREGKGNIHLDGYHSEYDEEEEVIFDVLSKFRIINVMEDKSRINQSWTIVL